MKVILIIALVVGIARAQVPTPNITIDCASSFVEIEFSEMFLDDLVLMPVRSVFFLKPTDDLGAVFSQNPPVTPCSTSDTGDYLSATFNNFQECAFATAQTGGQITYTYRGVLLTMHDSIVERDVRHYFTFECIYSDTYEVTTGPITTYLPNFFSMDMAAATMTPVISLWEDAGNSIPLSTVGGISTADRIYVTITNNNIFQIEVIRCATSLERAFGDRSQVDFIDAGAAVDMGVILGTLQATTVVFSFMPVVNAFDDRNVTLICEVEVCDLAATHTGCSKRRKRETEASDENGHYIVSASFRILPDFEPAGDEPQQNQPVADVPRDLSQPQQNNDEEMSTSTTEPASTTQEPSTTTFEPSTTTFEPSATTFEPSTTTHEPSTTTNEPLTNTDEPSKTTTTTTTKPSSTTTEPSFHGAVAQKKPNNRKPHKVNQHHNQHPGAGPISRVMNDDHNTSQQDQGASPSFLEYMKKADVLFYLAIALMALMVVVMMVVMYKKCVRNKKVAHVEDQEWAKN